MSIVSRIQSVGVRLQVEGADLVVLGQVDRLTNRQLGYLKSHKPQIIAELRVAGQPLPTERLRRLAGKYRLDPDELLDWYSQDHAYIQVMDDRTLDAMVRDYSANRPNFRGEQPYQTYQLWFYRLDKKKAGYVRQGLMTSDKDEALRRLETIYGHGNVLDLHSDDRK